MEVDCLEEVILLIRTLEKLGSDTKKCLHFSSCSRLCLRNRKKIKLRAKKKKVHQNVFCLQQRVGFLWNFSLCPVCQYNSGSITSIDWVNYFGEKIITFRVFRCYSDGCLHELICMFSMQMSCTSDQQVVQCITCFSEAEYNENIGVINCLMRQWKIFKMIKRPRN